MNIKQLIEKHDTDTLLDLLYTDELKPYIEQVKDYPDISFRKMMVEKGYFLDHYLYDDSTQVREQVIRHDANYVPKMIESQQPGNNDILYRYFMTHRNPNPEHLRAYIETDFTVDEQTKKEFKLRLYSLENKPNMLETTMSRKQLYLTGSPFWVRGYTIEQIYLVNALAKVNNERALDSIFQQADSYYDLPF